MDWLAVARDVQLSEVEELQLDYCAALWLVWPASGSWAFTCHDVRFCLAAGQDGDSRKSLCNSSGVGLQKTVQYLVLGYYRDLGGHLVQLKVKIAWLS